MIPPGSPGTVGSVLQRLLAKWTVLVAFAMAGALAALVYSSSRPPRYEAKAVLGVSISYAVTESLELVVEDRALSRALGLILSDEVFSRVLDRLPPAVREAEGWHTAADLRRNLRLDPRLAQWELVTVHEDPTLAASVSHLWGEAAIEALDSATAHAWRATALIGQKFDVKCGTIVDLPDGTPVTIWDCVTVPPLEDPTLIRDQIVNELALSRGILPDLTYELLQDAVPPSEPVLWGRGPLVLAGAFAGLVVGVGFCLLWFNRTKAEAPTT